MHAMPSENAPTIGDRRRDLIAVMWFLGLLALPLVAFGAGIRAESRENRPPAQMPKLSLADASDPGFFAAIDRYLADQFPFRNEAAAINAAAIYHVFRTSPNADVVVGEGDWLFSRSELEPQCEQDAAEMLDAIDRLAEAFSSASIDIRFVIVPDKQSIYADRRPDGFHPCSDALRQPIRDGMADRSTTTDLWTSLEDARRASDAPVFWLRDTHWSPDGGLAGIRRMIQDLDPSVWDEAAITRGGLAERMSDLANLMGLPTTERLPAVRVESANRITQELLPTNVVTTPGRELRQFIVTGPAPLINGTTLIIHDSAFGVQAGLISPWFETSVWLHINELVEHPQIVDDLPAFDHVIFERVERFAYGRSLLDTLVPILAAVSD